MVWKGDSRNRLAKSLVTLIDDIVERFPGRDDQNDGTIGDAAHQTRASDHNPHVRQDGMGIVTALDITHDPAEGFDAQAFADSLREQKDPRIKYVIFNGRIFSSTTEPWVWRKRNKGRGDHSEHVHISVVEDPRLYDDPSAWKYDLSHAARGPTPVFPPKLSRGDTGPAVIDLQSLLGITEDGTFGEETEEAVREFQARNNLFVDGIVGSHTWGVLKESLPKPDGTTGVSLTQPTIDEIVKLAANSPLVNIKWEDRGRAPPGYIKGMAATFGQVYAKLKAQDSAARLMAAQNSGNAARDALALYDPQFRAAGMDNSISGPATLRHLFVLLIGLGMRESSGKYNEGRDMSADNTTADTAEAGLFQMSWNARSASSELPRLFALYTKKPDGFLPIFQEGVKPKETPIIGAGEGAAFQRLCKSCPAFAAEAAAIGLRVLCRHWGPIKRHEVEIRPEADALLKKVQEVVDTMQPVPQPTPKPSPPGPKPKPIEDFPIPIPPIGIGAMNPFVLIAARVFPEILKAVVGDKAGTITGALTKVITDVTQTKTPEEARDKLNADPEAVAKLQLELAKIANDYELARRKAELDLIKEQNEQEIKRQQTQLEALRVRYEEDAKKREADFQAFRAGLDDTKDARASLRAMTAMAGADKWVLRAPPILSYIVAVGFFAVLTFLLIWGIAPLAQEPDAAQQVVYIVIGALTAALATVVNFWLGSSQSSQRKDAASERQAIHNTEFLEKSAKQNAEVLEKSAKQAEAQTKAFQSTIATVIERKAGVAATKASNAIERCVDIVLKHETDPDLKKLPPDQAREIYRTKYWNVLRCDDLPAGVDLVVFDFGAEAGPAAAAAALQRVVGAEADGSVGPATIAATKAGSPSNIVMRLSQLRREIKRGSSDGMSRINEVEIAAQQMTAAASAVAV